MEFLDSRCVDTGVLCTEADLVAVLQDCSHTYSQVNALHILILNIVKI